MPDENPTVQSGILDPLIGAGFFSSNMSLEEIKRRRAIAAALSSRARGFPKTVGEGMTYFGEALGEAFQERKLAAAEKEYSAKRDAEFPGITAAPPVPRPVADVPPTVDTAAAPAANRAPIYQALAAQNGAVPPGPMVTANASLNTGAAPAGPAPNGATFAEEGGGPNPPTVTDRIKPMVVADATGARPGGVGRVPGVFDPRTPERAIPAEKPASPLVEPKLAPETNDEKRMRDYQRKYRDDPIAVKNAQDVIDKLAGERQRDWTIKHEKWKIDYANELKQSDPAYLQKLDEDKKEAQRKADEYTTFPFGKARHEQMAKESAELVKGVPAAQIAIGNVRGLMASDAGMFTGADANVSQGLSKLAMALNLPYEPKTRDKVENTEAFKGFMVPILAALRPAVVGTGAQTAPELKLLQDAAAGNITLERGSIEKILNAVEHLNAVAAVQHHKRLISAAGGNDNARSVLFGQYELPIEDILPRSKVGLLRREIEAKGGDETAIKAEMEEFDRTYHTPGLARRILGRR